MRRKPGGCSAQPRGLGTPRGGGKEGRLLLRLQTAVSEWRLFEVPEFKVIMEIYLVLDIQTVFTFLET